VARARGFKEADMQEMNKEEMAKVDGGGWAGWASLYVAVVALACPPLAVGLGVASVALGAYDLITD